MEGNTEGCEWSDENNKRSDMCKVRGTCPANRTFPIVRRTVQQFFEDSIPTVAGGITFFFLLALFPSIASIVSLFGFFGDRREIIHILDLLADFLPGGAVSVLRTELLRLAQVSMEINAAFVGGALLALWSASGGYRALIYGLNVAFEVKETRSSFRLSVNAIIFTLLMVITVALVLNVGLLLPKLIANNSHNPVSKTAFQVFVWFASFCCFALILSLIYKIGPSNDRPTSWINWGSCLASGVWLAGTRLFTWYVGNYGDYDQVYGSLGAAVGFLTWTWLSFVVILMGAELNSEIDRDHDEAKNAKAETALTPFVPE